MLNTYVGYTGGSAESPTYESVCAGDGHTEAIRVEFDPEEISYDDMLAFYFKTADISPARAVTGKLFGGEKWTQYKNAVWTHSEEQRQKAEAVIASKGFGARMVEIEETKPFYEAEQYHQKYIEKKYRARMR